MSIKDGKELHFYLNHIKGSLKRFKIINDRYRIEVLKEVYFYATAPIQIRYLEVLIKTFLVEFLDPRPAKFYLG